MAALADEPKFLGPVRRRLAAVKAWHSDKARLQNGLSKRVPDLLSRYDGIMDDALAEALPLGRIDRGKYPAYDWERPLCHASELSLNSTILTFFKEAAKRDTIMAQQLADANSMYHFKPAKKLSTFHSRYPAPKAFGCCLDPILKSACTANHRKAELRDLRVMYLDTGMSELHALLRRLGVQLAHIEFGFDRLRASFLCEGRLPPLELLHRFWRWVEDFDLEDADGDDWNAFSRGRLVLRIHT